MQNPPATMPTRCLADRQGLHHPIHSVRNHDRPIGTDRYPPFTLARTDYPADFDVDYPEHLSHGLVLIKSWLLAIPQLIIIGLFTANVPFWWNTANDMSTAYQSTAGISLLGILVMVAGIVLLITRRYPPALFDLTLGLNRWIYRVVTYVALMRDEYPPFRLDQGGHEPVDRVTDGPIATPDPLGTPA